jgi:hypothetical protein
MKIARLAADATAELKKPDPVQPPMDTRTFVLAACAAVTRLLRIDIVASSKATLNSASGSANAALIGEENSVRQR